MISNQGGIFQGAGWTFSAYCCIIGVGNGTEMVDMDESGDEWRIWIEEKIRMWVMHMAYFLNLGQVQNGSNFGNEGYCILYQLLHISIYLYHIYIYIMYII